MSEILSLTPVAVKDSILEQLDQANEHRDFKVYNRSMDAALNAKAQAIFPHFGPLPQGAVIVDAGSGTGALAELAAQEWREEGVQVYALDISHELQETAKGGQSLIYLVFGDAAEKNFPDNSVHVKYYSTSGHEVETFGGEGRMREGAEATYNELVPGGRIVIRDFAKPTRTDPVYMQILSEVGLDDPTLASQNGVIDYNLLSSKALFERFHQEFRGGNAFEYEVVTIDGQEFIKIDPEWAAEFYLRKDYTGNWRQEIKEKYTYWSEDDAKTVLSDAGYTDIEVIPDPNEFILTNRLKGKIALFDLDESGQLVPMDFPPTHMVAVGVNPGAITGITPTSITDETSRIADYPKLKESISFDQETCVLTIGDQVFNTDPSRAPATGSKKQTFWLDGEPDRVVKVVRKDGLNDHNVFKAMFQAIDREHILDELGVVHPRILDIDPNGPPFRYFIQEAAPDDSICAADLIRNNALTETDVAQMARIVNDCELGKQWQLDTNPFNWHKVINDDGTSQMIYVDGKIYSYDEMWEFRRKGLLQWTDPSFVTDVPISTAKIPTIQEYEDLKARWAADESQVVQLWKKYLSPLTQPN